MYILEICRGLGGLYYELCVFIVYTDLYQTFGENINLTLLNHFLCYEFCNLTCVMLDLCVFIVHTDLYQMFGENINLTLLNLFYCFEFCDLTCVLLGLCVFIVYTD